MTILDRYIARLYLTNVVTLFVILFSFVVVIDVSLNVDRFFKVAVILGTSSEGVEPGFVRRVIIAVLVIADLWWPRLLQLFNFMLGLVLVAGMGFTCSQLVRNREFLAMLTAGISLRRVARPILVVAGGMTLLQALNQELIIPRVAPLLARDHGDAGKRGLGVTAAPLTADGRGWLYRAVSFDADSDVLTGVYIIERDPETRQAVREITADRAVWREGGWDLEGGLQRTIRVGEGTTRPAPTPIARVESSLDPTTLKMNRYKEFRNALSFAQIGQILSRGDQLDSQTRRELQRIRWGRISMMISSLLTLVMALPFFVTREPKNMVLQSLKCAPISIGALLLGVVGSSAMLSGVPPGIGAFLPVMVLSTAAVAVASQIKS